METIDELQEFLAANTAAGVRGRLIDRGQARSVIRREGVLPEGAPAFPPALDTDLLEYGLSVLRASMALREAGGNAETWRRGFLRSGQAFEARVRNGSGEPEDRGFVRILGAASYHLAGYSAMAYSLMNERTEALNLSPAEDALACLIFRNLDGLRTLTRAWLRDPDNGDEAVVGNLSAEEDAIESDDVVPVVLTSAIFRAFAYFDFALATGDARLHAIALDLLGTATRLGAVAGSVSLWWIARLSRNLIDDLWGNSLHVRLPPEGPQGSPNYFSLRELMISSLYSRATSEVELWPSQLEAAQRAADLTDDLVVSLPTSAGKTRIAEICALMALATDKRVLIVTPLRALSAQTERTFRRTFTPLGFDVSSLYGANSMVPGDDDALRSNDIVIATPEKLDFALRNDPTLIDDVGLIILDEGHLIGPSEREIRYEVLVQRLLRRQDADSRRIVCLSAILPEGQQLDDLAAWIRGDAPGDPIKSEWRPTRQRFGLLTWHGTYGRLTLGLENDGPYIPRFVTEQPAIRPRRTPFPRDARELTLSAAWQFAGDGRRVLIYCTQRDHVEGYATAIRDLTRRGFLPSLLEPGADLTRALAVGEEWLGAAHPALACLRVGVAIHHGRLPRPFLRELERLLAAGVLKVTVASPTLAQGLNLNAAVLLVPNLYRSGNPLSGEEFANVAGRAGRAYVDLEGLIIHVMFDPQRWRLQQWQGLINAAKARALESGLAQIIAEIIDRLASSGVLRRADAVEYLANNRAAWTGGEQPDGAEPLSYLVERLDTAILGLVEALDSDPENLPQLLDEALNGSLWSRFLARQNQRIQERQRLILQSRAKLIWSNSTAAQRRGHFAMGLGLEAGLSIDAVADQLVVRLDQADAAALAGDIDALCEALVACGNQLFEIRPFIPDREPPENWPGLLRQWLSGTDVAQIGVDNITFIEDAFAYRLVWGLEAIRMRRSVLGGEAEILGGGAAACLETGLPRMMMAMLVRAGLPSRAAALAAINDVEPIFINNAEMLAWLRDNQVAALTDGVTWPTPETASLWKQFRDDMLSGGTIRWTSREWQRNVDAGSYAAEPEANSTYRVEIDEADGSAWVCTPDFRRIVKLQRSVRDAGPSVFKATFQEAGGQATVHRVGRGEARWSVPPQH